MLVAIEAEMTNNRCISRVAHMKEIYKLNHWREIICFIHELGLQVRTFRAILEPNSKNFLGFCTKNPLKGIRVTNWLPCWVRVSLALISKSWVFCFMCFFFLFLKHPWIIFCSFHLFFSLFGLDTYKHA